LGYFYFWLFHIFLLIGKAAETQWHTT
jgi:hypothetical protein